MSLAYQISNSIYDSEVGIYPQIQDFSRVQANAPLYHYPSELGRYNDDIVFPVYRMESKAKLTDLISNVPLSIPLMISYKCLDVFRSKKLPDHQVFPLQFIYKGKLIVDYCAFSIGLKPEYLDRYIAWQLSKILEYSEDNKLLDEHRVSSMEELASLKKGLEIVNHKIKPQIKLIYKDDYSLMRFGRFPFPIGYFCTNEMKEAILGFGLTGFRFSETPNEMFV